MNTLSPSRKKPPGKPPTAPDWRIYLRRLGTLLGFAAIVGFFWMQLPDTFMTWRNWLNISQQISMLAVTAFTMTLVMVTGGFDLSVGSMASLGWHYRRHTFSRRATRVSGRQCGVTGRRCGRVIKRYFGEFCGHLAVCGNTGDVNDV